MASFLENALASDEYAESTGLDNEVERTSWRDTLRPDRETEPPPVTLGEDGNYYANDNRWNYGEWVTIVGDEPVYYVEGGVERDRVDEDQWEYDEYGNVVTKDADFAGDGHVAINPAGQWLTEQQIRDRWDSDFGMSNFRKANPNMSVDDYMGMMKETTALKAQGIERLGEGGVSPEYQAIYDKYGLETSYTGNDGAVYEWNGGGYTITQNGTDMGSMVLHGLALGILGAGISAGIAPVVSSVLGSAGSKAASSAIVNLAKQYMTTGELNFEDALMSAALSYGGSQLSDALNASGVVSDLASQFDQVTGDLVGNGGDILKSALSAGGMSLVSQLVKDGEIDWKDAALAAAMAGGTTALQGFLADIGKADEIDNLEEWDEYDEWQQEAIDADIKDPFLNPNYESVGDGLVKNINTGEVFGQGGIDSKSYGLFDDLDKDGDGVLNGNDLSEITTPDRDLKNIYGYEMGDTVYVDADGNPVDPKLVRFRSDGTYVGYDANGNRVTVTGTTYDQAFGGDKGGLEWQFGLNEDGSLSTTDGAIYHENGELAYQKVDGQWVDGDGNIVDDPTKVDELTLIAAKAIDEPLESIQYYDQDGNSITYRYPPYELRDNYEQGQFSGLIFGPNGEVQEVWYDPVTNTEYIKAQGTTEIIAIRNPETPPEPVDPQDPDQTYKNQDNADSSDDDGGSLSGSGDNADSGTPDDSSSANPLPTDTNDTSSPSTGSVGGYTSAQIAEIARVAGITVTEVINRLRAGESVESITSASGDVPTNLGGDVSDSNTSSDESDDNSGGNDTISSNPRPTPSPVNEAYEQRIADLMARGMSREEAERNQAYAIKVGADANNDGAVTDEEWSSRTGAAPNNGDNTSGSGSAGDGGVGADGTGGNSDGGNDTGGSTGNVDGSGDNGGAGTDNSGGGNGTGDGVGNGVGDGTGDGSGYGDGNGNGNGAGLGMLSGGGRDRPIWGDLFAQTQFRRHAPYQSKVTRSLFGDLMGIKR